MRSSVRFLIGQRLDWGETTKARSLMVFGSMPITAIGLFGVLFLCGLFSDPATSFSALIAMPIAVVVSIVLGIIPAIIILVVDTICDNNLISIFITPAVLSLGFALFYAYWTPVMAGIFVYFIIKFIYYFRQNRSFDYGVRSNESLHRTIN